MLDSVIYARDRYLKPGGVLMPNRCTISLAGYGDEVGHQSYINFWDNVYGFDYSCLKKDVLKEAVIENLPGEHMLTDPVVILNLNLMTCAVFQGFSYDFSLRVRRAGKLTSFIGYFDTFFDLPNSVAFSTSPSDPSTHWKQINFYLERPIEFKENDLITGKFICKRDRKDVRSLNISIEVFGRVFNYCLN
jgi:type I protein arginine methyltransferase